MIDYLERESEQPDALEEQRKKLADALAGAAAGGGGGTSEADRAEKERGAALDGEGEEYGRNGAALTAEEARKPEETLPLLAETERLERTLDSARAAERPLRAGRGLGMYRRTGRNAEGGWELPGAANRGRGPALLEEGALSAGRTGSFSRSQDPAADRDRARALDRIFQRDSRRYDGGFFLY